jgi:CubicO group peptidase (beta-lactamase class C family)
MKSPLDAVVQAAVTSGAVPNLVAVATADDDVIYEGAAGPRAAGDEQPVSVDGIFRIASMTKPICAVAAPSSPNPCPSPLPAYAEFERAVYQAAS